MVICAIIIITHCSLTILDTIKTNKEAIHCMTLVLCITKHGLSKEWCNNKLLFIQYFTILYRNSVYLLQNIVSVETFYFTRTSSWSWEGLTVKYLVLPDWYWILSILKTDDRFIEVGRYATLYMEFLCRIKRSYLRLSHVFPQSIPSSYI